MDYSTRKIILIVTVIIVIITITVAVFLLIIPIQAGTVYRDVPIEHSGRTRTYNYFVPANLPASPVPLVFTIHGGGINADQQFGLTGTKAPYKILLDIAEQEKFIVVAPDGTENPSDPNPEKLYWNDCRADMTLVNKSVDDVGFIETLITLFLHNFNIDPNRIYATGISNGGGMSLRLAIDLSHKIAAVAILSQGNANNSVCTGPVNPIPVLLMSGTADELNQWDGGYSEIESARGSTKSIPDTVAFWVNQNGADTVPEVTEIPNGPYNDHGTTVTLYDYDNGIQGTEVLLYKVNGGGHLEPSLTEQYSDTAEAFLGNQNHDIETAKEVWKFFKKHALNGPVSSVTLIGGNIVSVEDFCLLAPCIGVTLTIPVATVTTGIYVTRIWPRKKQ